MGRLGVLIAGLTATIALLCVPTSFTPSAFAQAADPAPPEACGFLDGFRTLREQIGAELVGDCLEHSRPTGGGVEQRTTGGLLVWNEILNLVSFTDGHQTWIAGPNGIEVRPNTERFAWEAEALRAAEAEAAARARALQAPSPRELALMYVERVRGNNDVSLEKIYLTAYYQAEHGVRDQLARAHAALRGSLAVTTQRFRHWLTTVVPP